VLVRPGIPLTGGQNHPAGADAEVEELYDLPVCLLAEDVLTGYPEVGGTGLDIGRNVGGPHRDQGHSTGLEQKRTTVRARTRGIHSGSIEKVGDFTEE
jgi:hypothetical protein